MGAVNLAEYVIWYANQKGIRITSLKLQKILYLLQCECLHRFGTPLFDDRIEAWDYGPVVRTVYFEFCANGCMPLTVESFDVSWYSSLTRRIRSMIDEELERYLPLSGRELVCITRSTPPYRNLRGRVLCGEKPPITLESMKTYYCNYER